ncbi:peptidoglycan-binding protein [Leptolyngbya sp. FACHB-711]|uniref:peptidoglycan-binding protein n=1 Tax=Leptolyngbya sp. FACHB-711 TaxID=2692813 RepID=UPI0016828E6A|nr:peptidoglycan-binding protein [Leptolyngbya sp. FACHB-711]MBD2025814.1 peptidoglycan-binding protein [Leptolyngbya sp. FACHB-711]
MTDSIIELCTEINDRDKNGIRASFRGPLEDAPSAASTSIANGLSQQLIHQLQLILPNVFTSFDDLNVDLLDAAYPYVQTAAKQGLQRAIQDRGAKMLVNSCYRTIAQQMLLYIDRHNNSNPVAPPGASNHQTGLAIDIEDARGWEPYLMRYGWNPLPGDPPHFDFQGGGTTDIRSKSILAFQQLWNKNNPNNKIGEDGAFGPQTEGALNQSPAHGFAKAPWDDKPRVLKLTQPRMEGSDVERLQDTLKKAGINIAVDGEFGPGTDKAVKEFQQKKSLTADGIVGPNTRAVM